MCVRVFVCVCVGFDIHACCRSIVNDITDCNSCLFSVSVSVFLFWFCKCVSILVFYVSDGLCMFVCLHDYSVTKYLNSC